MPSKRKLSNHLNPGASGIDTTAVDTKPKIRRTQASAPKLKTHMLLMFIGNQFELTTIHSALFPERTMAIITEKAQQHGAYVLTDEVATPETFELYRLFLYTGEISSHDADNDQDHVDDGHAAAHEDREWVRLANAYLLGLKLEDEKFRNAVVDALLEKVAEADRYPTSLAADVYAQTTPGDKLRSLIVDLHVWKGMGTGVRAPHDDATGPLEFAQDVLSGMAAAGSAVYADDVAMPWELDVCGKYHVHVHTAACEWTGKKTKGKKAGSGGGHALGKSSPKKRKMVAAAVEAADVDAMVL